MPKKDKPKVAERFRSPDELAIAWRHEDTDLPGLIFKTARVFQGEKALLLERGQILRTLGYGSSRIGWRFLGLGTRHRGVFIARSDEVSVPLRFFRLGATEDEPLDAFSRARVLLEDVTALYRSTVPAQTKTTARDLGNTVAAAIYDYVNQAVSRRDWNQLLADPSLGEVVAREMETQLGDVLRERGLRLVGLYPFGFKPSSEVERVLAEAASLEEELSTPGEKDWDKLKDRLHQLATWSSTLGFAPFEDLQKLEGYLVDALSTTDATLLGNVTTAIRRVFGLLPDRAKQLDERLGVRAGAVPASHRFWTSLDIALTYALVLAALGAAPAYLLWFRNEGLAWPVYVATAGGVLGTLRLMIQGVEELEKRLRSRWQVREKGEAEAPRLSRSEALDRENLLRVRIARGLENEIARDLQDKASEAFASGLGKEAQSLEALSQRAYNVATVIGSAPIGGSVVAQAGSRDDPIPARVISFGEDCLRLFSALSSGVEEIKAGELSPDTLAPLIRKAGAALDSLSRHFDNRAIFLSGLSGVSPRATPLSQSQS